MRPKDGLKLAVCFGLGAMLACGSSEPNIIYIYPAEAGPTPEPEPEPLPQGTSSSTSSSSGSPHGQVDAAPPPEPPFNGFARRTLRAGKSPIVSLIGITTGPTPHVVYYISVDAGITFDVEAVPVAGGTPVVLQAKIPNEDFAYVSGGAVAWYTSTDTIGIADAINIWTPLNGKKTIATLTRDAFFFANVDGSRVAFSVDATVDSTNIAVTTSAAPVATAPVLTGPNAMNWAANLEMCSGSFGFVTDVFIGGYCTGVNPKTVQPRLVTVDAAGMAVVRVDDSVPANDIFPEWRADATGKKILVTTPTFEGRLLVADGPTTTTESIGVFKQSVVTDDGLVVFVSQADGVLKKATFASPPVVTPLVPDLKTAELIAVVRNHVIFGTQRTQGGSDLKVVDDDSATPQAVTLVGTANVSFQGITGDEARAIYFSPLGGVSGALKSIPLGGGTALDLDPASRLVLPANTGTGVLTLTAVTTPPNQPARTFTFKYTDAAKGGALADAVRFTNGGDLGFISGKTFIFTDDAVGLIAVDLP